MPNAVRRIIPYMLAIDAFSVTLAGCKVGNGPKDETSYKNIPNIADGPDVCFRLVASRLGKDLKVSVVKSSFSVGETLDRPESEPKGQMTACWLEYQDPENPGRLLATKWNFKTGKFQTPVPVEIEVFGGNPADFRVEDNVIPLSQVRYEALADFITRQQAGISKSYSQYGWDRIELDDPDHFHSRHRITIGMKGRLAVNNVLVNGHVDLATDGKKIQVDTITH